MDRWSGVAGRFFRGAVSMPDNIALGVRAPVGRGHASDRPARSDRPADCWNPARPLDPRGAVTPTAAHDLPAESRAKGDDRGCLATRHSDAAADRDENRPVGSAKVARHRAQRIVHRHRHTLCMRLRDRRIVAKHDAAAPGTAPDHVVVSRHRAIDLFGQDRRDGSAREGLHAAHIRPIDCHFGDYRRHHLLDHHGRDIRSCASRRDRPRLSHSEYCRDRAAPVREFYRRAATGVLADSMG